MKTAKLDMELMTDGNGIRYNQKFLVFANGQRINVSHRANGRPFAVMNGKRVNVHFREFLHNLPMRFENNEWIQACAW
jgi:hypothetical protein